MQARWWKKSELEQKKSEGEKKGEKSESSAIIEKDKTAPIKIEFKDDDDYKRERNISPEEKAFKGIEKAAIGLTKIGLKMKKLFGKNDQEKFDIKEPQGKEIAEREAFRRLIAFVFSDQFLEEFVSVVQALGFKNLGGFEQLGRRDADYTMAKDIDLVHRLHFRVYRIKGNIFVLVHYEPKATEDIGLHIKGFFDRIINQIILQQKNPSAKVDTHAGGDGTIKVELSNYEKGADILLKILKDEVPNFYRKINSEIHENELALWKEFMGFIDHKTPDQLIEENLYESSRLIPPFTQIRDTVKKIFEHLNFQTVPAWDLKVPASDKYFIAKTTYATIDFEILVITEDFVDEIMRIIGFLRTKYNPKFILVITPEIAIYGPTEDDIPPPNVEIPKYDPSRVRDLLNFLADAGVSIITVNILIELFHLHLKTPLRHSHINLLLTNKGLIKQEMIQEIMQENDTYQKFIRDVQSVFEILHKNKRNEWISIKQFLKIIKESAMELNQTELTNILILMENPLLALIESKNNRHEEFRIVSSLTEDEIEFQVKKMKKMIEQYLMEQKASSSYL